VNLPKNEEAPIPKRSSVSGPRFVSLALAHVKASYLNDLIAPSTFTSCIGKAFGRNDALP
jgi:hypothetical protein